MAIPAIDIVFLGIGLLIIVFAVVSSRWLSSSPVNIAIEKIGTFQMQMVPFLIILGLLAAGVGQFFRWRDYEGKIARLDWLEREVESFHTELTRLKNYEMSVNLRFPDSMVDKLAEKKVVGQIYSRKAGEPVSKLAPAPAELGATESGNVLATKLANLNSGDKIFLVITDVSATPARRWKSDTLEIPVASLAMREE